MTLREAVREEIADIYGNAEREGYVNDDDICDELGDYYDDVQDSDDDELKRGYALARSAFEEEHDTAMALLKQALEVLA